jgi:hypothetical protein
MPCPENLIPCKPGETHNPNGRPKGRKSISTYLKMLVEGDLKNLPDGKLKEQLLAQGFDSVAAALAHKKVIIALDKNVKTETQLKAMDSIEDRLEGKSTQKTELTGKDGEPLLMAEAKSYEESLRAMSPDELVAHQKLMEEANKIREAAKEKARKKEIE